MKRRKRKRGKEENRKEFQWKKKAEKEMKEDRGEKWRNGREEGREDRRRNIKKKTEQKKKCLRRHKIFKFKRYWLDTYFLLKSIRAAVLTFIQVTGDETHYWSTGLVQHTILTYILRRT